MVIELPLSGGVRLAAAVVAAVGLGLALAAPTTWPWRLATAAAVAVLAGSGWGRYLRARPRALQTLPRGRLQCRLADGEEIEVVECLPGVVRPWLATARLVAADGRVMPLFVPRDAVDAATHWQLRRAVRGFRRPGADGPPGSVV